PLDTAHGRLIRIPMRRDHEDLARPRQLARERRPRLRVAHVLDGERRGAMRKEYGGKSRHGDRSTCRRPRRSSTRARIASETMKKAPVRRIASRWLPPVIHVTAPYVSGPRMAARRVATPQRPKNSPLRSGGEK